MNEFGAKLIIDTESDKPNTLDSLLNIKATSLIFKGKPYRNLKGVEIPHKTYDYNLWIFETKMYKSSKLHINVSIENILDILDNNKSAFKNILKKYSKYHITCYAYFYEANPYIAMSRETLKRLVEYNLEVEFDLYCFGG